MTTPDARELFVLAEAFPHFDHIKKRYAIEQELPVSAVDEHVKELFRFLAIVAEGQHKGIQYAMRGPIDELWHTFIVFTAKYAAFCDTLGVGFIHHFPNIDTPRRANYGPKAGTSVGDVKKLSDQYEAFLRRYKEVFREDAPAHLWPKPFDTACEFSSPSCVCGISCA